MERYSTQKMPALPSEVADCQLLEAQRVWERIPLACSVLAVPSQHPLQQTRYRPKTTAGLTLRRHRY